MQDNWKVRPNLTLELGLRYDWNMSPTERFDRFVVFDPAQFAEPRRGGHRSGLPRQHDFQPRFGIAWDPFKDGKTGPRGLRHAGRPACDEPGDGASTNPPLANPILSRAPNPGLITAAPECAAASDWLQPRSTQVHNAYIQSWNLNVQREITRSGRVPRLLRIEGNAPSNLRATSISFESSAAFPHFSTQRDSSGAALGNIFEVGSAGIQVITRCGYPRRTTLARAPVQRLIHVVEIARLQLAELAGRGGAGQLQHRGDRGLSDYDARHRFVMSGLYELPFKGNRLVEGWQLSACSIAERQPDQRRH